MKIIVFVVLLLAAIYAITIQHIPHNLNDMNNKHDTLNSYQKSEKKNELSEVSADPKFTNSSRLDRNSTHINTSQATLHFGIHNSEKENLTNPNNVNT